MKTKVQLLSEAYASVTEGKYLNNYGMYKGKLKGTPLGEEWFKEGSFKTYKMPANEPFEIAKEDGTLRTLEGPREYKTGFYIIIGPKEEKYSMPSEKFKELKDDNGNE